MDADELTDEITAVEGVHRSVPDQGRRQEQGQAGNELDVQQGLEIPAP